MAKFVSKRKREALVEPLVIELREKTYRIERITARQMDQVMEFHRALREKDLAERRRLRALGEDPAAELERARAEYRQKRIEQGIEPAAVDVSGVTLATPTLAEIAMYVGAILGESPDALLDGDVAELNELCEFLGEHLKPFLEWKSESEPVKN